MAIYRDGKLVGSDGGVGGMGGLSQSQVDGRIAPWARTGQDRPVEVVETLPAAIDADNDVIYVIEGDGTEWIRKSTVNGLTHRRAHPVSGLSFEGVFDDDLGFPNASDFYFNNVQNKFRLWTGIGWEDRTLAEVFGSNRIAIGIGTGTPAPAVDDTVDEAVQYLADNGYDSTQTYIFYDSATSYPDAVREVLTVTYDHEMIQVAKSLKGNAFDDYADREIVAIGDRDDATKITLEHDSGTTYDLHIERNSDFVHLQDADTGTAVRLSEGNSLWQGRVESYTKTGNVYVFKINFFVTRSTFTTEANIHVEFGAYPLSRTTYFYGWNQTERVPADIMGRAPSDTGTAAHELYTNGIKRFDGVANENIHGGIAYEFLNSNNLSDADNKQDTPNTALQINESGHFHFKIKGFGNQNNDGNVRLRIYKIMSGDDDVALLSISAWHATPPTLSSEDQETVTEYFDEEQYIDVASGDQFMMVLVGYQPAQHLLACYLEIERVD